MPSSYRIQVVDTRDKSVVATWPPGLTKEQDVIEDLIARVRRKQVDVNADILARVSEQQGGFLQRLASRVIAIPAVSEPPSFLRRLVSRRKPADVQADILSQAREQQVGFLQRDAHVLAVVRQELQERDANVLLAVRQALEEGFHNLKSRVPVPK